MKETTESILVPGVTYLQLRQSYMPYSINSKANLMWDGILVSTTNLIEVDGFVKM